MAGRDELRFLQTNYLYQLLRIKIRNEKAGIKVLELNSAINQAKAQMTEPDIAWVEKQIAEVSDEF